MLKTDRFIVDKKTGEKHYAVLEGCGAKCGKVCAGLTSEGWCLNSCVDEHQGYVFGPTKYSSLMEKLCKKKTS